MQTKYFVETGRDGCQQFVRVKSSSSHHHHRPHRAADPDDRLCRRHANCLHVPLGEWNELVRSERKLHRECDALKGSLDGAMDAAERERRCAARLRHELERVCRDRDCLAVEVRELRRGRRGGGEIERAVRAWQEKFECAQMIIEEKVGIIEAHRDEIARQGRLLRRHRIIG